MRKMIILLSTIIILMNFIISGKKIINPIDDDALKLIEEVDGLIFEYKTSKNFSIVNKARVIISNLKNFSKNNKYFEAKVIGLLCQLEMSYDYNENIEKHILDIERRNKNEEKLFIIKSEIEKDKNNKEKILLEGIDKNEDSIYLKLYLANNYYSSGKFDKAVIYFDEIFYKLPECYKKAFKNQRDLSTKFLKNPPKNLEITDILIKEEVTIGDMLRLILYETNFFSLYNISQLVAVEDVFNILTNYDFFYIDQGKDEKNTSDSLLKRKDLAYFILKFLVKMENNPSLNNKYSGNYNYMNYASGNLKGQIPDVDINNYFYNAVMLLVERETLDLPDGELFYPEKSISGIKLYEIIKKLAGIYKIL